jgi:hypothetical protein
MSEDLRPERMNGVFGKPAHDLGTCSSQTSTLGLVFGQSKHGSRE